MAATTKAAEVVVVRRRRGKGLDKKDPALYGPPRRGMPKSGRPWKPIPDEPASALVKDSGKVHKRAMSKTWQRKQRERLAKKQTLDLQREIRARQEAEREAERERLKEKRRIKAENERKAEVVQKITNSAKLKRMTKKQLRRIEKR